MAGINMPSRPKSNNANLLSLAGAGAGALIGGPAGAGIGMQVGGMAGSMNQPQQGPEAVGTGAMSRRMSQLDQTPLRQIRESIDSLKFVEDDAQRMELAKPLVMAEMKAKKGPGQYGG